MYVLCSKPRLVPTTTQKCYAHVRNGCRLAKRGIFVIQCSSDICITKQKGFVFKNIQRDTEMGVHFFVFFKFRENN